MRHPARPASRRDAPQLRDSERWVVSRYLIIVELDPHTDVEPSQFAERIENWREVRSVRVMSVEDDEQLVKMAVVKTATDEAPEPTEDELPFDASQSIREYEHEQYSSRRATIERHTARRAEMVRRAQMARREVLEAYDRAAASGGPTGTDARVRAAYKTSEFEDGKPPTSDE